MKRFVLYCVVLANYYFTIEPVSAARIRNYNANARIREFYSNGVKLTTASPTTSKPSTTIRGPVRSINASPARRRPVRPIDLLLVSSDDDELVGLVREPAKTTSNSVSTVSSTTTTKQPTTFKKGPYFVSSTVEPFKKFPHQPQDGPGVTNKNQSVIIQTKQSPVKSVFQGPHHTKPANVPPSSTTSEPSSVSVKGPFFVKQNVPVKHFADIYLTAVAPQTFDDSKTALKDEPSEILTTPPVAKGPFFTGNQNPKPPSSAFYLKPTAPSVVKDSTHKKREDDDYETTTAPSIDELLDFYFGERPLPSRADIFFATAAPPFNQNTESSKKNSVKPMDVSDIFITTAAPVGGVGERLSYATTAPPVDLLKLFVTKSSDKHDASFTTAPDLKLREKPIVGPFNKPLFQNIRDERPSKIDNVFFTTEAPAASDYASTDYYDDADNYVENDYYDEGNHQAGEDDVDIDSIVQLPVKPVPVKPLLQSITFTLNDLKFKRPAAPSTTSTTSTSTVPTTTTTTVKPKLIKTKQSVKQTGTYEMTDMYSVLPIAPDMSSASYLNDLAENTNYQLQIPLNSSFAIPISIAPSAVPSYSPDMMMYQMNSTIEDMILSAYFPMMMANFTSMMSTIYNNYTMYMNSLFDLTTTTTTAMPSSSAEPIYWPCINLTSSTETTRAATSTTPAPAIGTFYIAPSSSLSSSVSSTSTSSSSGSVSVLSSGGLSSTLLAGFFLILPVAAGIIALLDFPPVVIAVVVGLGLPLLLFLLFNVSGVSAFGRDEKIKYQFKGLEGLASEWDRHSAAIMDIIDSYTLEKENYFT